MKTIPLLIVFLYSILFWSCSDFHLASISHGSLPQPSTQDTIRIPADSIIVPELFAYNDTAVFTQTLIRANRRLQVSFTIQPQADFADSILVYGTVLADDSLFFNIQSAGVSAPIPNVQTTQNNGIYEHNIQFRVYAGVHYTMHWQSAHEQPFNTAALLLAGYHSTTTPLPITPITQPALYVYEMETISLNHNTTINPGHHRFYPILLLPNDSLYIRFAPDTTLNAYVLTNPQMSSFINSGTQPSNYEWFGNTTQKHYRYSEKQQSMHYLVSNTANHPIQYSDSVEVFTRIKAY